MLVSLLSSFVTDQADEVEDRIVALENELTTQEHKHDVELDECRQQCELADRGTNRSLGQRNTKKL